MAVSSNPRADLVTAFRQDAAALNLAMDQFVAHRAEYIGRNINFVAGDLNGANNTGSFTADDVDQMVVDMNTIVNAIRSGGTINVGVWTNVLKIK